MGKVAFVFPGQGAHKVGMGKAAHDETEAGRAAFKAADAALGEAAQEGGARRKLFLARVSPQPQAGGKHRVGGLVVQERARAAAAIELGQSLFWIRYSKRGRPAVGVEALIDARAEVVTECRPRGTVRLQGELEALFQRTALGHGLGNIRVECHGCCQR